METLQAVGVAAGALRDGHSAFADDPQLRHRGFWRQAEHQELGRIVQEGMPIDLPATPERLPRFAPLPGDDNDLVLG